METLEKKTKEKIVISGISLPISPKTAVDSLMSIYKKNHNQLTPESVVKAASSPRHPLHPCFEWDNDKAGEQYRLHQAGNLIRCVQVVTKTNGTDAVKVRAFINVKYDSTNSLTHNPFNIKGDSHYVSITDAMNDKNLRQYTVEIALNELKNWMNKYKSIKELAEIFDFIENKTIKYKTKTINN